MKCPRFRSCIYFSVTATVAFTGFICLPARAGSFVINEQSVSGLGTAYAGGAAQAEDASTIFFNPAGTALLPQGEAEPSRRFRRDRKQHIEQSILSGSTGCFCRIWRSRSIHSRVRHSDGNRPTPKPALFRRDAMESLRCTAMIGTSVSR